MDNLEEQEYIRKVKDGEHAAFAFLVDRYKGMAYSIALKILGNEEDAQDVAQEGFIKAYQQLQQFQGKSKFSTWLYTIVYRTALAKAKETKIRTVSITQQFKETFTNDYSTPQLTLMQSDDEHRSVNLAVNSLSKTDGLLVILYYIDENSLKEIQQITGMSIANIKIRLFRARKKLERELRFLMDDNQSGLPYEKRRG